MTVLKSVMPSVDRPPNVSRTTAQKVTSDPTKPSSYLECFSAAAPPKIELKVKPSYIELLLP